MKVVDVALPVVLDRSFTYVVPSDWPSTPEEGSRVLVSFGPRVLHGVVRPGPAKAPAGVTCKPLLALSSKVGLPEELVSLCEWLARYYVAPVGEAYRLALPGLLLGTDARTFRMTKQGQARLSALEFGPLYQESSSSSSSSGDTQKDRALLEALAGFGRKKTPLSRVIKQLSKIPGAYAKLDELAQRGDCELLWEDQGDKPSQEMHYRCPESVHGDMRTKSEAELSEVVGKSKQRRGLLDDLLGQKPGRWIPISELRSRFPRVRELTKRLVEAGLVQEELRERQGDAMGELSQIARTEPLALTNDQAKALEALTEGLAKNAFESFLLFGVTGSGKTEVYLQFIAKALNEGGTAIVLVPEIALTPQLAGRFRARFGETVAVLHSALSDRQRLETWQKLRNGTCKIAIGARSAIFAPVENLRVVIVDEEHDASFKQDEGVRYHGRDVALVRAQKAGAVVVLGSATPSLESLMLARKGRHRMLELPHRVTPKPLPEVELLSLTEHQPNSETLMSAKLKRAVETAVEAGEQVILFLNRRGFTTQLRCEACGESPSCPDCSGVSLTYHRKKNRWVCHLCGYMCDPTPNCPSCHAPKLKHLSAGTERVQDAIEKELAPIRVLRLDRDTSRGSNLNEVLTRFRNREADVLVGTQMLSKGHDFPGVTLVGVLCADQGLGLPDPRASERVFSLLTQVAGRAGRGERPGRVIIQAWSVQTHPLPFVLDHDYRGFSEYELQSRRELSNPPWGHLVLLRVSGPNAQKVRKRIEELDARIEAAGALVKEAPERLGPVPSPIERVNRRTRWQLLLRAAQRETLRQILHVIRPHLGIQGRQDEQTVASVDVDPHQLM